MPFVEVSVGELLDKWSILEIKRTKLVKDSQQMNILAEMGVLEKTCKTYLSDDVILSTYRSLYKVNSEIWEGMDKLYTLDTSLSQFYIDLTNQHKSHFSNRRSTLLYLHLDKNHIHLVYQL